MKKEEMTKIVNEELKTLMPPGLTDKQQKLWRFLFNMVRRNDLVREHSKVGAVIARECIERLKQTNPKEFSPDMKL